MAFGKKTIKDIGIESGTRVLMRADFNVPLGESGEILDDYRIQSALPTIEYLISKGAKLVIMSHLGRPEGKPNPMLTLAPIAKYLDDYLDSPVVFIDDTVGDKARQAADDLEPGTTLILENIRFNPGDEVDDDEFSKQLASFGDLFVFDGFGVSHRSHASTTGVARHLPAVAGLLVEKEVSQITGIMRSPERPVLSIVGGAKISDKIDALNNLIDISDVVAIGGAMANTFLKADGMNVGKSLVEDDALDIAREILEKAREKQANTDFTFYVPEDGVVSKSMDGLDGTRIVDWSTHTYADIQAFPGLPKPSSYEVGEDEMILDIGPSSTNYIVGLIRMAKTVIWNGNLGYTEARPKAGTVGPFEHASHRVLGALDKKHSPRNQYSFIGGGDTASYVLKSREVQLPDLVSTGGGAALDLLSNKPLPGVDALQDK